MSYRFASGAALAMLAAGPVFVFNLMVGVMLYDTLGAQELGAEIAGMLMLTIFAVPFGAVIALLPVLAGGYGMGWLGLRWTPARHPVLWGVAGALLGGAMLLAFAGFGDPGVWGAPALFSATGAICALIVRYRTRWSDDSV